MMEDKDTKILESLGLNEKSLNKKTFIVITVFTATLLTLSIRLLQLANILDFISCICVCVVVGIFYLFMLSFKDSWVLYLLTHPFIFNGVTKSNYKFVDEDLTKVHIDDLDIDDTLIVTTIRKQYLFYKYVVRIFLVFYSLIFLYSVTDIKLFLLMFITGGEVVLYIAAVYVLFSNTLSPIIYKKYSMDLEKLYIKGYISPKQYKAIRFYEGSYLKESNLFSRDECVNLIDSYIDRVLIATKYKEYTLYKMECKIKYVSFLICFFFVLNNITHFYYYLLLLGWYAFYEITGFVFNKIKQNSSNKIKQNVSRYMPEVLQNYVLLNYFVVRNLPRDILSRI